MGRKLFKTLLLASGCAAVLAAGCQQEVSFAGRDSLPAPTVEDRPTSLAFNSPRLEAGGLSVAASNSVGEIPWYLYRNDFPLSTEAGYRSPVYEQSSNYTYDQQIQSNGQVHDYFYSTTYRTRYHEAISP